MRWALFAGSTCAALLASAVVARAEVTYPYCAFASGGYGAAFDNCGFVSLEQCRQTVSGGGGWCQVNPRYAPNPAVMQEGRSRAARPRTRL